MGERRPSGSNTRRAFLKQGAALLGASVWGTACADPVALSRVGDPRLTVGVGAPLEAPLRGLSPLGLGSERDGFLYVPTRVHPRFALPLMVILHGAGGSAHGAWLPWITLAEERNIILLAPDSRSFTWDLMETGMYGPDRAFLDEALAYTFRRCRVQRGRIALGGFSDGATYALSLGVSNGNLFSHLVAFAPVAFVPGSPIVGQPRIYVFQGTRDYGLLGPTRDQIVPELLRMRYQVLYEEFEAGHTVTLEVSERALDWMRG